MNTKHTIGQWKATEVHNGYYSIGTGAVEYIDTKGKLKQGFSPVAFVGGNYCPIDEAKANAQLIAAAPELLNAAILCESISDKCNNAMLPKHIQELLQSINETLKAAISKATL